MNSMSTETWVVIAIVAIVGIAALGTWMIIQKRRTDRLRAQFGPEYTREFARSRDRRRVEIKLDDRMKRVEHLHIRPLSARDRTRYLESWHMIQTHFLDNPGAAMAEAEQLLSDVMLTRGYPADNNDFEQRAADISVDHPMVVESYRQARGIAVLHARGKASTEDQRQATIYYRTVFEELLNEPSQMPARIAS